ncbi:YhgE/Pip domain-containing protein [Eubacteriaceae bacterium ES3]|nr:YhgE/Pip domain-containing protein [Eubacteriaceae bacterium ES3]
MKKISKKKILPLIVIIGVIIIPLMYSFFYLCAFWDPYSRLDTLPIAVVNLDQGAIINGTQRNLGEEFIDELSEDNSFDYVITNEKDGRFGTENSEYYALILVPQEFTADIASAGDINKQTANIIFSSNEKKNYLASQILSRAELEMESSLRESISAEIVDNLTAEIEEVPDQLNTLDDGLQDLSDGSSQLVTGTESIASGSQSLESGAYKLATGTNELEAGTEEFSTQFALFNDGLSTLENGSSQINNGAQNLSDGSLQLNSAIETYSAGVEQLITNVGSTSSFIESFVYSHPELMNDPQFAAFIANLSSEDNISSLAQLETAGQQLTQVSQAIAEGASLLAAGTENLNSGMIEVKSASEQLATAAGDISNGASQLSKGADTLATGASTLSAGVDELTDGQTQLNAGITEAQNGVQTAINNANAELPKLEGINEFVSEPVSIEDDIIEPIDNYGTYFSPYFMSLSLWVGALIIFFGIYFDADQKFRILSRESSQKTLRSFIYLFLGFCQAILLGLIIKYALGLEIEHNGLYFISICLVSMVFLSIVQFCIVHMGDIGKFVSLALLILQLTSCGGTFPIETVPKFFQILYPYMPMTYSVIVFKDTITGQISNDFWRSFGILLIFLLVFFTATLILSFLKKRLKEKRAYSINV